MNNLTPQQRKMILICGAIVGASYLIHSAITFVRQQEYLRQQFIRAQQQRAKAEAQAKAKAKEKAQKDAAARAAKAAAAKAVPGAKSSQAAPKPPAPSPYAGIWTGRTAIDGRGTCTLHLELTDKPGESNHFTGFSSMVCNNAGPLVGRGAMSRKALALNRMDPEAAILSGTLEKTSVELTAEKTVGADSNGCSTSSLSLTPFGKGQLAAEFKESTCQGGHMILKKGRR
jgi:hypothetical protein